MSTLWERAKASKGQIALLCDEPGIGKSRVTKTWLNLIADEPHIVIRYHCSPRHTNSAVARPDEGGLKPPRMEVEQSRKRFLADISGFRTFLERSVTQTVKSSGRSLDRHNGWGLFPIMAATNKLFGAHEQVRGQGQSD